MRPSYIFIWRTISFSYNKNHYFPPIWHLVAPPRKQNPMFPLYIPQLNRNDFLTPHMHHILIPYIHNILIPYIPRLSIIDILSPYKYIIYSQHTNILILYIPQHDQNDILTSYMHHILIFGIHNISGLT